MLFKVFDYQCALFRKLSNLVVREFLLEKSLCVSMRDKSSCQQAVSEQISCHSWPKGRDLLKMFDDITLWAVLHKQRKAVNVLNCAVRMCLCRSVSGSQNWCVVENTKMHFNTQCWVQLISEWLVLQQPFYK